MTRPHGRQRVPFDDCIRSSTRGRHVCRNGLQIHQNVLDHAGLGVLADALDAGVIAEAVDAAVAELPAGQADFVNQRAAITAELAQSVAWERRLRDALVDGDGTAEAVPARVGSRGYLRRPARVGWPARDGSGANPSIAAAAIPGSAKGLRLRHLLHPRTAPDVDEVGPELHRAEPLSRL